MDFRFSVPSPRGRKPMVPWSKRNRAVAGLAAVVLLIALGGIAYATIPDSDGVIHGCYQKSSGLLRVIDTDTGQSCASSEKPVSWNQTGPEGPTGPQGVTGPPGTGPSEGWDAQAFGVVPAGGADTLLDGGVTNIPPGNYLLSGSASWPPVGS